MQELDWPTILSGAGVFITTCVLTYKGWQDRKKEEKEGEVTTPRIIAGVIQDNASIHANTEAVKQLTAKVDRLCDILMLTAAMNKLGHD